MYFGQVTRWKAFSVVSSNHPYLVFIEGASCLQVQVFFILEEDVFCDCLPVSEDFSVYASSLVFLIAVYYSFNLEYSDCWKYLFKILEEHVLDIPPKWKSYALKQLENILLKNLNGERSSV